MAVIELYEDGASQEQDRVAAQIRERRGGRLLNIDRALLLSLSFAEGYNVLLPKVRNELELSDRIKELAILTTSHCLNAEYEVRAHAPLFAAAGGRKAQIEALRRPEMAQHDLENFNEAERAIIGFAVQATLHVHVSDAVFAQLRRHFPRDTEILELTALVAPYNMVCRIVVPLRIPFD